MSTDTTIPVQVSREAAAHVEALGMRDEFERMLDHTRRTVPGLRAVRVALDNDPSGTTGPGVVIWSYRDDPGPGEDPVDQEWGAWKVTTFPPDVCLHFVMLSIYEGADDGR